MAQKRFSQRCDQVDRLLQNIHHNHRLSSDRNHSHEFKEEFEQECLNLFQTCIHTYDRHKRYKRGKITQNNTNPKPSTRNITNNDPSDTAIGTLSPTHFKSTSVPVVAGLSPKKVTFDNKQTDDSNVSNNSTNSDDKVKAIRTVKTEWELSQEEVKTMDGKSSPRKSLSSDDKSLGSVLENLAMEKQESNEKRALLYQQFAGKKSINSTFEEIIQNPLLFWKNAKKFVRKNYLVIREEKREFLESKQQTNDLNSKKSHYNNNNSNSNSNNSETISIEDDISSVSNTPMSAATSERGLSDSDSNETDEKVTRAHTDTSDTQRTPNSIDNDSNQTKSDSNSPNSQIDAKIDESSDKKWTHASKNATKIPNNHIVSQSVSDIPTISAVMASVANDSEKVSPLRQSSNTKKRDTYNNSKHKKNTTRFRYPEPKTSARSRSHSRSRNSSKLKNNKTKINNNEKQKRAIRAKLYHTRSKSSIKIIPDIDEIEDAGKPPPLIKDEFQNQTLLIRLEKELGRKPTIKAPKSLKVPFIAC